MVEKFGEGGNTSLVPTPHSVHKFQGGGGVRFWQRGVDVLPLPPP